MYKKRKPLKLFPRSDLVKRSYVKRWAKRAVAEILIEFGRQL